MSKSAEAFRTISEVAEVLDTPAHVLRFWESRFAQIKPVKRAGSRRYYRPADVALLGGIKKLLHDDGLTIRGVQKMLREKGVRAVAAFSGLSDETEDTQTRQWPQSASPEVSVPDDLFPVDPDDLAEPGLFSSAFDPAVAAGRPARTKGGEARAELQREREAALAELQALAPDAHYDPALQEGDFIPAAALVRAMSTYRVAQRRDDLIAIYHRLDALYHRRRAQGE